MASLTEASAASAVLPSDMQPVSDVVAGISAPRNAGGHVFVGGAGSPEQQGPGGLAAFLDGMSASVFSEGKVDGK
jgi:hypothetical protein